MEQFMQTPFYFDYMSQSKARADKQQIKNEEQDWWLRNFGDTIYAHAGDKLLEIKRGENLFGKTRSKLWQDGQQDSVDTECGERIILSCYSEH